MSILSNVVLDFGETLRKCGWLGGALGFLLARAIIASLGSAVVGDLVS